MYRGLTAEATLEVELHRLFLLTGIMATGAVVQGSVGFGLNLLAVPLLVLVDPALVPGPVLAAALVLTLLMAYRERQAIDLSGLGWAFAGRVPGTVGGLGALLLLPAEYLAVAFAALVLLAVVLSATGLRIRRTPRALLTAGAASGFMSTTSAIGGPPMALVYQSESGHRLRGTLSGYFVVGALMSITALALVDRFGAAELRATLALLPGIVIGFSLSAPMARMLDRGWTRPAVLLLAALASMAVIVRELSSAFSPG